VEIQRRRFDEKNSDCMCKPIDVIFVKRMWLDRHWVRGHDESGGFL
jgi:hypothetical protein